MKLIESISGTIKNSNKEIKIKLNGNNLIIAGGNGSGKTSLVAAIHQTIWSQIPQHQIRNITTHENNIRIFTEALNDPNTDQSMHSYYQQNLQSSQQALEAANTPIRIEYNDPYRAIELYNDKKATFRFFTADRKAEISGVSSATASQPDIQLLDLNMSPGNSLEQHLVNLKVRSALAMQAGEIGKRPLHAEEWITSFTENLKYLFEDQSTELIFSPDELRFYISQSGKPQYNFQSLSSGYLAIFDIYANLIMHTEHAQIKPSELSGVVIIDEIDAHLHVSLQRKILPFFTNSFPSIQFIVTTHSPFVLTSVDNATIFDLTTCKTLLDLSMYSYESIIEGLLGVPPISKIFEDTIKKLTKVTSTDFFDLNVAENLLSTITPYIDVLDAESEMFYQIAANKIIKMKAENN
ncbi:AAA family ATPase [Pseudomonas sp. TB1-B1]|uniref:AAA family ATPase n=1 Tax=Pseudomonas sp. TB1-B1 TaxID=2985515 RepID=UPI00226FF0BC|nr:AAA family ATPase [Pseudomonas sp. TB1-B1]MCX9150549.1 ATP-binding protein [Pseudomonas sp. TB1-B1]